MNAPTPPFCVVNVGIVLAADCEPNSLQVPLIQGAPGVVLTFQVSQADQNNGWVFDTSQPSVDGEDVYFGISIFNDRGVEFTDAIANPSTHPTSVTFTDLDNNSEVYAYSVRLTNTFTGQVATSDPSIVNQSVRQPTKRARRRRR